MNFRRFSKAIAAVVLATGLVTAGVTPAMAAPTHAPSSQQDTGWGRK